MLPKYNHNVAKQRYEKLQLYYDVIRHCYNFDLLCFIHVILVHRTYKNWLVSCCISFFWGLVKEFSLMTRLNVRRRVKIGHKTN